MAKDTVIDTIERIKKQRAQLDQDLASIKGSPEALEMIEQLETERSQAEAAAADLHAKWKALKRENVQHTSRVAEIDQMIEILRPVNPIPGHTIGL